MIDRVVAAAAGLCMGLMVSTAMAAGLVVHGDSTGKGDGAQTRWTARLMDVLGEQRPVENLSRNRQGVKAMADGAIELGPQAEAVTVFYDRRNAGETPEDYIGHLKRAVAALGTDRYLILPQVPVSGGREDGLTLEVMLTINTLLRAAFPDNSFDEATEAEFLAALSSDDTRSDRIHRNDTGQQIEAEFIAAWLKDKRW